MRQQQLTARNVVNTSLTTFTTGEELVSNWWGNTQGRDQWESWALGDMQAGDTGAKTSITWPLTRHSREPQQMRLLGNQAMLGGERGHRFLTLITRRNLNCYQERGSISGKGNLHAKAKTWNEAECFQDKQGAGRNFLLLCSWSVGNEMARKAESGSGPHCLADTLSGSRWAITPSWLSGSLQPFLYSSSVYSCHLFLISYASEVWPFLSFIIFAWTKVKGLQLGLGFRLRVSLIFLKRSLAFPMLVFLCFSAWFT